MSPAPTTDSVPATNTSFLLTIVFVVIALGVLLLLWQPPATPPVSHADKVESTSTVVMQNAYEVAIRKPIGPPSVKTGLLDAQGNAITAACNTCHATRAANVDLRMGSPLNTFHQGLKGHHGDLTCVSCHNSKGGYQTLKLADDRSLPFREVMQLCAQCHGPQYRDYQHGAHGGMTGYWDLSKGPRQRNNCIDCHDPHAPKYPIVRPAPGPQDRMLLPSQDKQGASHE